MIYTYNHRIIEIACWNRKKIKIAMEEDTFGYIVDEVRKDSLIIIYQLQGRF